ncbi:MAG: hypothetical protein R2789_09035 [Microthrixaceae bacterium]
MSTLDDIFKAYDVRGTVPDQLNPDLARAIGTGFATFVKEEAAGRGEVCEGVIVGRDMRPSGVELVAAFAERVTAEGLDVPRHRLGLHRHVLLRCGLSGGSSRDVHRIPQSGWLQREEVRTPRAPARSARTAVWIGSRWSPPRSSTAVAAKPRGRRAA